MIYLRFYLRNGANFSIECKKYNLRTSSLDGSITSYNIEGLKYNFVVNINDIVSILEISKEEYEKEHRV